MPTTTQKQSLLDAVAQIRAAEQVLLEMSRSTSDVAKLIQINTEYTHLDSCLSQILHAQALVDDGEFDTATAALKVQTTSLCEEMETIDRIVNDVALAAKIAGSVAQAAKIIATL
jgi:hypothetical protein